MSYIVYLINPNMDSGKFDVLKTCETGLEAEIYLETIMKYPVIHKPINTINWKEYDDNCYFVKDNTKYTLYKKTTYTKKNNKILDIIITDKIIIKTILCYIITKVGKSVETMENIKLEKKIVESILEQKNDPYNNYCHFMNKQCDDIIWCYNISSKNNGLCNMHQNNFSNHAAHKVFVINIIKKLLDECTISIGRNNKLIIAKYIFNFIVVNKWIIECNNGFKTVVLNKLKEFCNQITCEESKILNPQKYLNFFESKMVEYNDLVSSNDLIELQTFIQKYDKKLKK